MGHLHGHGDGGRRLRRSEPGALGEQEPHAGLPHQDAGAHPGERD